MKTSLLILAVVACACAVFAFPEAEERPPNSEDVLMYLDKLSADLTAEFSDDKFLEEKFGNIPEVNVQLAGKFGWLKKLPWGQIIDAVIGGVKKVLEPKDKKDE